MGLLVLALNEDAGNIQQRVFDAFPPFPGIVTLDSLVLALPFARDSIVEAIWRLRRRKVVELAPKVACCVYRRSKGASNPVDMRGHHGNSGRRPKQAA